MFSSGIEIKSYICHSKMNFKLLFYFHYIEREREEEKIYQLKLEGLTHNAGGSQSNSQKRKRQGKEE